MILERRRQAMQNIPSLPATSKDLSTKKVLSKRMPHCAVIINHTSSAATGAATSGTYGDELVNEVGGCVC